MLIIFHGLIDQDVTQMLRLVELVFFFEVGAFSFVQKIVDGIKLQTLAQDLGEMLHLPFTRTATQSTNRLDLFTDTTLLGKPLQVFIGKCCQLFRHIFYPFKSPLLFGSADCLIH